MKLFDRWGIRVSVGEGFFARTRDWAGGVLAETARNAADETLRWALKVGVRYLVAGAILVAGAVFVLVGLKEGGVAAGLPPYLASLGLAVLAGLAGYGLLTTAPAKPRREPGPGGVSIHIEKKAAASPRRARESLDVHPAREGGWEVTGNRRRSRGTRYRTKQKAVRAAERQAARKGGADVVIRRADGTVQETESVGDEGRG